MLDTFVFYTFAEGYNTCEIGNSRLIDWLIWNVYKPSAQRVLILGIQESFVFSMLSSQIDKS